GGAIWLGANCQGHDSRVRNSARAAKIDKSRARGANRIRLSTLLQIVPNFPEGIGGVEYYALTIAKKLYDQFGYGTVFASKRFDREPGSTSPSVYGFDVLPLNRSLDELEQKYENVLLHYVNYGFQKRGVPFRLLAIVRALRQQH